MPSMKFHAPDPLRAARDLVRGNPDGVAAIDAADREAADKAAKHAKKLSEARAKVDAQVPERSRQLVEDYAALQAEAIQAAAEKLARAQLEHRLVMPLTGVKPTVAIAATPPLRLTDALVDVQVKRLIGAAPLTWGPKGTPASEVRRADLAEAARAVDEAAQARSRVIVTGPDKADPDRRARAEDERRATIRARKVQAGIIPADAT